MTTLARSRPKPVPLDEEARRKKRELESALEREPPIEIEIPTRLRDLAPPVTSFSVRGDLSAAARGVIAIVGTREPSAEALAFTGALSKACVDAGFVVASGGAFGIDARAHEAAIDAGGRTWVVLPSGPPRFTPTSNAAVFLRTLKSGGALLWPFPESTFVPLYFLRNRVLAALADAVVVVQAGFASGARNTAKCARKLGRPLWVVGISPWTEGYEGNGIEIDAGARTLTSIGSFIGAVRRDIETTPPLSSPGATPLGQKAQQSLALPIAPRPNPSVDLLNPEEIRLAEAAGPLPKHLDDLAQIAGLSSSVATTALLTLVLEHVLVEGPAGHYRRPP